MNNTPLTVGEIAEITASLRDMATYDCGREDESDLVIQAADVIEKQHNHIAQLEAELAELREENEANEAYIVGLNATIDLCLKRFHNINNKAVEFHEVGPHDEKESLRRVMEIYDMSLLPKGTDNEVD